jgi:type II secretory pathway component PulM
MTIRERIAQLAAPWINAVAERARPVCRNIFARAEEITAPARKTARAWYERREAREKLLLKVLGGILGVFLIYSLIFVPVIDLRDNLKARIVSRQQELVQVRSMMRTWKRLQVDLTDAQKHTVPEGKDFSLFSVVEQTLTSSVGRDKIGSITPVDKPVPGGFIQHSVDLKLAGISLAQIVDTLYRVQTLAVPVTVSNLHIRQRDQDLHSYDVDMTCSALGKNG